MSRCCVATPRKFSMSANLDVTHHLSAPGTGRLGTAELFLKRRSGTAARAAAKLNLGPSKGSGRRLQCVAVKQNKKMLRCIKERQ